MRMMVDLKSQRGSHHIIDTPISVDCTPRAVKYRRSFRSLVECMVPCCGFQQFSYNDSVSDTYETLVTGTFFGYKKGRVSFCLQEHTRGSPLFLLEFAVPTAFLAREMQHGLVRIALENSQGFGSKTSLYDVPVWSMFCNGRKVGFAIKRQLTSNDATILETMQSVSAGAGVVPRENCNNIKKLGIEIEETGDLMYLRASFERVVGSVDSESYHMVSPGESDGQELSIFMLRS